MAWEWVYDRDDAEEYWREENGEPDRRSRTEQARPGVKGERVSNDGLDRILRQGE